MLSEPVDMQEKQRLLVSRYYRHVILADFSNHCFIFQKKERRFRWTFSIRWVLKGRNTHVVFTLHAKHPEQFTRLYLSAI